MDNNDPNTPLDNQPTQAPVTPGETIITPAPTQPEVTPAEEQVVTSSDVSPVAAPVASAPAPIQSAPTEPQPVAAAPAASPLDDLFDQIAEKIIEQQEAIIGPIAVEQARSVKELKIDWANQHDVDIEGSPQVAIDELVEQYKELFGQIAVETCKEAVAKLLAQVPADQQPTSLKA